MNEIFELGIAIILFIQGLGAWLLAPMKLATFLGYEEFYLFVAPAIYWCFSTSLGLRLGLSLMISGSLNSVLKMAMHGPRPYWLDPKVHPYSSEISFGVPSGHAQNATVVWGTLAAWLRRRWAWVAAGVLIFLIGFSRLYLAVHFPHDVLLGWLIGALLLWLILALEGRLMAWLGKMKITEQALAALGFSLAMILLGALMRLGWSNWSFPAEWAQNAASAVTQIEPINPWALSGIVSNAGTFFGLALGGLWIKSRNGFDVSGPAWQRLARFLIGVAGVALLWYGLGAVFPRGETWLPFLLRYLRYALVGLWITGLSPILFIRFGLAKPLQS
ncbi:MAG: phosphatase PAP2 family protein [Chloroflexota bacterium]